MTQLTHSESLPLTNEEHLDHIIGATGFVRLESAPNGDCFFTCLESYFKLLELPLCEKSHTDLRLDLVTYMLTDIDKYKPYVAREYKVKSEKQRERYLEMYITREIKKLAQDHIYNTELGDIVPSAAVEAFGIHIVIHNWSWAMRTLELIDLKPEFSSPSNTIHLLRINENHYDLLLTAKIFTEEVSDRWDMLSMMRDTVDI